MKAWHISEQEDVSVVADVLETISEKIRSAAPLCALIVTGRPFDCFSTILFRLQINTQLRSELQEALSILRIFCGVITDEQYTLQSLMALRLSVDRNMNVVGAQMECGCLDMNRVIDQGEGESPFLALAAAAFGSSTAASLSCRRSRYLSRNALPSTEWFVESLGSLTNTSIFRKYGSEAFINALRAVWLFGQLSFGGESEHLELKSDNASQLLSALLQCDVSTFIVNGIVNEAVVRDLLIVSDGCDSYHRRELVVIAWPCYCTTGS